MSELEIKKIKESQAILMAVGDIMVGDFYPRVGVRSILKRKNFFIFEHVDQILSKADIVFGNLETVLSDLEQTISYESLMLRGRPMFVEQLKKAHFSVINVANNHLQEYGEKVALDSINNLREAGFKIIGIDDFQPQIVTIRNIRFGFLGYSFRPEQSICNKIIYSQGNTGKISVDIIKAKRMKYVDYLIVSLHWGDEYIEVPSKQQISLAHQFIDSGADVILGHHSHVLQNIEEYNKGVIIYSLGNFVSDMYPKRTKKSVIFEIMFSKNRIENINPIPVYSNTRHQPELLSEEEGKSVIRKINKQPVVLTRKEYEKRLKLYSKQLKFEWFIFLIKNFCKLPPKYLLRYFHSFVRRKFAKLFKEKDGM